MNNEYTTKVKLDNKNLNALAQALVEKLDVVFYIPSGGDKQEYYQEVMSDIQHEVKYLKQKGYKNFTDNPKISLLEESEIPKEDCCLLTGEIDSSGRMVVYVE